MLFAFLSGLIFGCGLILAQMTNPKRVQGFLDVFGDWDPTLIAVMAGALVVTTIGYQLIFRLAKPLYAEGFELPTKQKIDPPLILGSLLFGIGWGLSGLCPAPAFVDITQFNTQVIVFVVSLLVGMKLYRSS